MVSLIKRPGYRIRLLRTYAARSFSKADPFDVILRYRVSAALHGVSIPEHPVKAGFSVERVRMTESCGSSSEIRNYRFACDEINLDQKCKELSYVLPNGRMQVAKMPCRKPRLPVLVADLCQVPRIKGPPYSNMSILATKVLVMKHLPRHMRV